MEMNLFWNEMQKLHVKIKSYICEFFSENNLESINMLPYVSNGYIDAFTFFDVDNDGYGVALSVDSIEYNKDKNEIKAVLSDYEGVHEVTRSFVDFNTQELLYLADMLSMIKRAHETKNIPYFAIGEEFDFDELLFQ